MSDGFNEIFHHLRAIMIDAAPGLTVTKDEPASFELRTPEIDERTKQLGWFGAIMIKKSYVAYHLMPLDKHPELAADITPELVKRKQGKTCFNFARADEALFAELGAVTRTCVNTVSG